MNNQWTIDEAEVKIPGLKKTYTFLHFSDAHTCHAYPGDGAAAFETVERQTAAWRFEDTSPQETFDQALAYARQEKMDAMLMAGDCVDYFTQSNVQYMRECLAKTPVEALYVLGNHEGCNYAPFRGNYEGCYPYYQDLMQGNASFWVKDYGEFLVIGLDDSQQNITREQLELFKAQAARNLPILLLLHIPLCTEAIYPSVMKKWGPTFMLGTEEDSETTKEFCRFVKQEDSHVAAIFAGHIHYAHEGEFAPGRMQYVSGPCLSRYLRRVRVTG